MAFHAPSGAFSNQRVTRRSTRWFSTGDPDRVVGHGAIAWPTGARGHDEGGDGGGRETREGIRYAIVEQGCPVVPGRLLLTGRLDLPHLELVEKPLVLSPAAQRLLAGHRAGPSWPRAVRSAARNWRVLSSSSTIKMRPFVTPLVAGEWRSSPRMKPTLSGLSRLQAWVLLLVAMTAPPLDATDRGRLPASYAVSVLRK